jgi:thiol:disulfide interchange protein DsbD
MRFIRWLVGWGEVGLLACAAQGATQTKASLVLAAAAARPGEQVWAAIRLRMAPKWHTYWVNPGDSGGATEVEWTLPPGVSVGELLWPVPEKHTLAGLTTYVYYNEVCLLAPLRLDPALAPGRRQIQAKVSWLECAELCLPGEATVSATLEVGSDAKPSADAGLLRAWQDKLPRHEPPVGIRVAWVDAPSGNERSLQIQWEPGGPSDAADFFPYAAGSYEVESATERSWPDPGSVRLTKRLKRLEGDWPTTVSGVLVTRTQPAIVAQVVALALPAEAGTPTAPEPLAAPVSPPVRPSLLLMLAFALLGGLILNVMPCVLPVIALKVLGFLNQARESPAEVRKHGLIYGAGVLVSFLALAGVVIGVQQGGRAASWGMQFQNPQFLVGMTLLVTLVALNLFGLFEVTLRGEVMGAAASLASREGNAGAFFNGVLATALATPCTAPFLGLALGFAFTQPPWVVLLTLLTVGVGLAGPYVAICFVPGLGRFLPQPGPWMERFKVAMGFPMLATAVWLLSLLARHYGQDGVLWFGLFLVVVALAAWVWGQFVQRGQRGRGWVAILCLALAAGAYTYALEGQLQWRSPRARSPVGPTHGPTGGIAWQPWSREAVAQARTEGRPVLVDFTADWCVTCQANKRTSLEIPSVQAKLKALNAVALLGDYTLRDDAITAELQRWGRAGVPLVLVYPRDGRSPPMVLPELLTPGIVLGALAKAAQ